MILEAARRAPTGANRQNWRMIVVTDPELKEKTAEACSNQMWMADAPVILCLVTLPGGWQVDGTIVLDHAILAATSLGYGTCWIGAFDEAGVKQVLNVPADKKIVICMTLGMPTGKHVARGRKAVEEFIYLNQFGSRSKLSGA